MTQSSIHAYCNEWNSLFGGNSDVVSLDSLKRTCVEGRLQGSRFRSICWRLLLNCLPAKKSAWTEAAQKWRQRFADLKTRHNIDPHQIGGSPSDLQYNNPLSLDTKNPWQQYFDDAELRACIKQDVERTFPELEYFQSPTVREMMIEILFLYGRENPHIAYKQGMHEILGPLIFVLFFDHETFEHASKEGSFDILDPTSKHLLSLLTDEKYLEHDAYEMFTQIMLIIQPWYYFADEQQPQQQDSDQKKAKGTACSQQFPTEPFARVQDIGQSSVVVRKLNWIGDNLLKHSDSQLYHHLEKLDIPPQIYGIRWLRLLFGREFPIQDLLFLWDAIFADGPPFTLVDYIFVAMLVFIRDLLLDCDYTGCLHYLMRYPPVTDVNRLLAVALHLQNPQKHPKPVISSMQTNFSTITITGRPHPNMQRQTESMTNRLVGPNSDDPTTLTASVNKTLGSTIQKLNKAGAAVMDGILEPGTISSKIEIVNSVDLKKSTIRQVQPIQQRSGSFKGQRSENLRQNGNPKGSPGSARASSPSNVRIVTKKGSGVFSRQGSLLSEEEVELLKEQISCLQVRLSDVEQKAHLVADKLTDCADVLSNRLAALNASTEDEAYRTVAYIQRLCRVLKGTESLGILGVDGSTDNATLGVGMSIPYKHGDMDSIGSPITMDGLNTPVEIGSDPTRSPVVFDSPRAHATGMRMTSSTQHSHTSKQQQPVNASQHVTPTKSLHQGKLGNDGGGKGKALPSSVVMTRNSPTKLGAENELKEICKPKSATASSGDE